jgi:aspartate carbamoyltransferase regulatory subunit
MKDIDIKLKFPEGRTRITSINRKETRIGRKDLIIYCRSSFLNSNRSDELALFRRQPGGNVISDSDIVGVSLLTSVLVVGSDRSKIPLLVTLEQAF